MRDAPLPDSAPDSDPGSRSAARLGFRLETGPAAAEIVPDSAALAGDSAFAAGAPMRLVPWHADLDCAGLRERRDAQQGAGPASLPSPRTGHAPTAMPPDASVPLWSSPSLFFPLLDVK